MKARARRSSTTEASDEITLDEVERIVILQRRARRTCASAAHSAAECGGASEKEIVSQTFQPAGRFSAANSVALHAHDAVDFVSDGKEKIGLRAYASDAGAEFAELRARTAVVRELLKEISYQPGVDLLRKKPGQAPVEMAVDAVLILRRRIFEIVG